jgi:transposase
MSKNRKKFTPEAKVAILKKHLVEQDPISDLCDEYRLQPNMLYRWQKEFFEKGTLAFEPAKEDGRARLERKIEELEKKLAHKNEVISELMEETIKLKKNLGEI